MESGRRRHRVSDVMTRARRVVVRHLSAIGQALFAYNPWVGLAGIVILAVAAPHLAVTGLLVSVLARLVASAVGASATFLGTGLAELNGWFLGLACGTFFAVGPGLAAAILLGGIVISPISIALHRVLSAWDVPLVIGPYIPVFWMLWSGLTATSWTRAAVLPTVPPAPASPLLLVLLGGLRGVGQIFFLPNAAAGVALAVAASIADIYLGAAMIAASIAAVGVGYLAGLPLWQVETGLAGFSAALIAAAARCRFAGVGWIAVIITVVTIPFLEAAALKIAGAIAIHALSAPYVALIWLFALLRPTPSSGGTPSSSRGGDWPAGRRPRLFGEA